MRARLARRRLGLVVLLVLTGTAAPVLNEEAASRLAARQAARFAPAAAMANRLPAAAPLAQASPPSPSGAEPPYPLNHTFDGERTFPGSPPTNHGFEEAPVAVGTAPQNHDAQTAPTDVGSPPTNPDFETGDLTGWTAAGAATIQSDPAQGFYARLATSASVTSEAIVVDAAAQAVVANVYFVSATSYSGVEVRVLSGAGYATSTQVAQVSCYQCARWEAVTGNLAAWRGQSVKLKLSWWLGTVGVDDVRQQVVLAGHEVGGTFSRPVEAGGNAYARLGSGGVLTTAAFAVPAEAQLATLRLSGVTTGSDQAYLHVLSGAGFATSTQVFAGTLADAWTALSANVAAWRGQEIKPKVTRALGTVGIDDLGTQAVLLPGWEFAGVPARPTDGPSGAYVSTRGDVTTAAFALDPAAQQVTLAVKGVAGVGSAFYLELLTGAGFGTVVPLTFEAADTTVWQTRAYGVAPYAGETVKLRLRPNFGATVLLDEVAVPEAVAPGWTPTSIDAIAVGEDANGTYATPAKPTGAMVLDSSPVSPGIVDGLGGDLRFYSLTYDVGYSTGNLLQVFWTDAATGQDATVFQDGANAPTGVRTRWFYLADFLGTTGTFTVKLAGGGRVYQLGDNVARQQFAEPFSQKVGVQVDPATGAFGTGAIDLRLHDPILPVAYARYYNAHSDQRGTLGYRWSHTFDVRLEFAANGDAGVVLGAGKAEFFDWRDPIGGTPGFYPADPRVNATLTENPDGSYAYRTPANLTYHFSPLAVFTHVEDLHENRIVVARDAAGRVDLVTDPGGRALDFVYDANGRLSAVTDPEGGTVAYGYDAGGDLTTVTDPAGGVTAYAYSRHRLTSITDPTDELVVTNTLDGVNRVTAQTDALDHAVGFAYGTPGTGATRVSDPNGHAADYHFDRFGRTTATVDATARVTRFLYDEVGNLHAVVDPAGQEAEATFDDAGFPTEVTDPVGNPVSIAYNPQHLPTQVTDARGKLWTYEYDLDGNRTKVINPLNQAVAYSHDAYGNVLTETVDPGAPPHLNLETAYGYDSAGNLTSITDPLDHTWSWSYDATGRVTSATDPLDRTTTYRYNVRGFLEEVEDATGGVWRFLYDPAGRRTSETNPLGTATPSDPDDHVTRWTWDDRGFPQTATDQAGEVWSYTYDAAGNLTSVADPLGHATAYEYDGANRIAAEVDAAGGRTEYAYDAAGRIASVEDPIGRVTTYAYDLNGWLTGVEVPNGGVWTYAYDAAGNRTAVTDPLLNAWTWTYDDAGRLLTETDPRDHTTSHAYDAAGRVTSVTDARGKATAYGYDGAGRLVTVTDPLSHSTTYGYDAADNLTGVTDALNRTTTYGFDDLDRLVAVTDPLNRTTTYEYDALGHRTRVVLPSGRSSAYAYDRRGLLVSETVPVDASLSLVTSHAYDDAGRPVAETNPRGVATAYGYDDAGRVTSVTDALGGVVTFGYDLAGQVLSETNARGKATTFTYDSLGNVLTETDPLGRTRSYAYDLAGQLDTATDPRGFVADHGYDAAGNLTGVVARDGAGATQETVGFTYDEVGRQVQVSDATGATSWTYDDAGRVTQVASPQGTIAYGYDAADRRTSMTLPGNRTTTYAYDPAGQLTGLTDWQNPATTFGYDLDGNRTSVARPNDVGTAYAYDGAGRLSLVEHANGPTMLQRFVYTLDANGNRTAVTHNGGTETYVVDQLDRITSATYPDGQTVEYAYDPNGNRTTQKVNGAVVAAYEYDNADQLLSDGSIAYVFDASGNLTQAGSDAFAWDWAGRMSGATAGGQATTYAYAADGARAGKTTGGAATSYLWDREAGLPELVDDGSQAYLHADGVLAGVDGAGATTYPLADGVGSVRGRTDGSGALVGTSDYDAFGAPRGGTGVGGTFGFAGEQRDAETGQVHLRARQYAPGLGRFTSRDGVIPNAAGTQGYNPYAYAANNPTTLVNPSGHTVSAPAPPIGPAVDGLTRVIGPATRLVVTQSTNLAIDAGGYTGRLHGAMAIRALGTGAATSEFALTGTVVGVGSPLLALAAVVTLLILAVVLAILMSLVLAELVDWCYADGGCGTGEAVDVEVVGKAEFAITAAKQTVEISLGGDAQALPGECSSLVAPFAPSGQGCDVLPPGGPKTDSCDRPQDGSRQDRIILTLTFMPEWSAKQRLVARYTVWALDDAAKAGRLKVTKDIKRTGGTDRYVRGCSSRPTRCDVDHLIDLQLGGKDVIKNMWFLDQSVNRSLGSQIRHQIKCYPDGTPVVGVRIVYER